MTHRRTIKNRKRCHVCSAFFYHSSMRAKACSPACSKEADRRRATARAKIARDAAREAALRALLARPDIEDVADEPVHCDAARVFKWEKVIEGWMR